jgi:hypothetical protein
MKLIVTKGTVGMFVYVFIRDSSSTTGAGLTGLAYNTAGLTAYYVRPFGNPTAITLVSGTNGAFTAGALYEVSSANMPGLYRFDVPDVVFSSNTPFWSYVMLKGAANMEPCVMEFQLTSFELQTALSSQTVGAVASGVNTVQLAGQAVTAAAGVTFPASVASPTNITAGTITTVTNLTNAPTAGDLTSTMKTSVKTQMTDALNVDTYAEVGQGNPPATPTFRQALWYLYKAWRNKHTQTSSTYSLYADDATTVDQKASVADDGTALTRGEVSTGP